MSSIETKTGARIKILPARTKDALEREVCVLGSIVSNLKAQELLSARVSEKTQDDARMVRLLRMLVPSGSVRHIVASRARTCRGCSMRAARRSDCDRRRNGRTSRKGCYSPVPPATAQGPSISSRARLQRIRTSVHTGTAMFSRHRFRCV